MVLIDKHLFGTVDKVQEAVDLLKQYEPPEDYYVAFSGGKDSLCIYWLCKIAGVKFDAHYNFTTVDPPELVAFVRTFPDVIIELPKENIWKLIVKNGQPPLRISRYCCRSLKEGGGRDRVKVLGVRAEESNKRKGRNVIELDSRLGSKIINIIYHWTELDVWEFIHWNLIDYCSLYDEGYDRLGCVACPLAGTKKMENDFKRWPLYRAAYVRAFDKMIVERNRKGRLTDWQTGEDVMHWWLYGSEKVDANQIELWERAK